MMRRRVLLQLKLNASGVAHSDFRMRMRALLEEVKARGDPKADDQSIAGLLLKLRDPKTGGAQHAAFRMIALSELSQARSHDRP